MRKLDRRQFGKVVTAGAVGGHACGGAEGTKGTERPNIIFLLTDDQRWDTLGCMGNGIVQTPALDRLAREGSLFNNSFVTSSICAPSRASILTGLYARCHGIHEFNTGLVGDNLQQSYPLALRRAGYLTGFIGKYGVAGGGVTSDDLARLPTEEFDYFRGFPGQGSYFPDPEDPQRHLTRIMGDQAIEFLDECSLSQPFCLSISFKAPHREVPTDLIHGQGHWFGDPAFEHLYKNAEIPLPKHATEQYFEALPPFLKQDYAGRVRWLNYMNNMGYGELIKNYYRLLTGVDHQVGRILDELAAKALSSNTIVIFTSDNGFLLGDRGLVDKYIMYEESIRTPLIIMDPRTPAAKGITREEMVLNIDIAPTILDLAGVGVPAWMNGRSLVPLLGTAEPEWRSEWFYEHLFELRRPEEFPKSEGVRTKRWKYVRWIEQEPLYEQLFDMETDPGELHNLAGSSAHRAEIRSMRAKCDRWERQLEDWSRTTAWGDPS